MSEGDNIFVYGTLKKEMLGKVMPEIKPYVRFSNRGYVNGKLYDLGEFPGAKPSKSADKKVYGQLLNIKPGFEEKVLKELDEYEEFYPLAKVNSLFKRQRVKVFTNDANVVDAWIYWYNKPVEEINEIGSGIYKKVDNL